MFLLLNVSLRVRGAKSDHSIGQLWDVCDLRTINKNIFHKAIGKHSND